MTELYTTRGEYDMEYNTILLESDLSDISTLPYNGCEVLGVSNNGAYCLISLSKSTVSELIAGEHVTL